MPQHKRGGQRTTLRDSLSPPPFTWVPGANSGHQVLPSSEPSGRPFSSDILLSVIIQEPMGCEVRYRVPSVEWLYM